MPAQYYFCAQGETSHVADTYRFRDAWVGRGYRRGARPTDGAGCGHVRRAHQFTELIGRPNTLYYAPFRLTAERGGLYHPGKLTLAPAGAQIGIEAHAGIAHKQAAPGGYLQRAGAHRYQPVLYQRRHLRQILGKVVGKSDAVSRFNHVKIEAKPANQRFDGIPTQAIVAAKRHATDRYLSGQRYRDNCA